MKITRILSILVLICMSAMALHAQKIKVESGSFKALKGQKVMDIEYFYDNMIVGKKDKEADYVEKKIAKGNENEAGLGDKWAVSWVTDRASRFEPKFEQLLNKILGDKNMKVDQEADDATYTLMVYTTYTEPGFNAYVVKKDAEIDLLITLVKSDDPKKVLGKMTLKGSPGRSMMGGDFDTGNRITEAYAKAGKEFGKYLLKKGMK